MNTDTIQPGSICTITSELTDKDYEIEARSAVVNSRVQFKFYNVFEWVHVSKIKSVRN